MLPLLKMPTTARTMIALKDIRRRCTIAAIFLIMAPSAFAADDEPKARVLTAIEMMMAGAQADRLDVVLHLLKRGVDVNSQAKNGITALIVATASNSKDVIEALLVRGADVNLANAEGWTPLMEAAYRDRPAIVKRLLRAGAKVNLVETRNGFTALMVAARGDKTDSVSALLEAGSKVNRVDTRSGASALHLALASRKKMSAQIAAELLVNGADADLRARNGDTPLMAAIRSGKLAKVTLVLSENVDLAARTDDGRTALTEAAALGHDTVVRHLLRAGAKPSAGAVTALTEAIRAESMEVARLLIDAGANPGHTGRGGKAPLVLAVLNGNEELVKLLLDKGAQINERHPKDGTTALMWAANTGEKRLVQLLMDRGADLSIRALDGWTAGEAARMAGHHEIAKMLERQT